MLSDTERKKYVYFGDVLCEYLGMAELFGKTYYEIMFNGVRKTVPASRCKPEKQNNLKEDTNGK